MKTLGNKDPIEPCDANIRKDGENVSVTLGNVSRHTAEEINNAEAWATWVAEEKWDYFATFTTRYDMTLKSTRRLMERFVDRAKRFTMAEDLRLFWVAEKYELKDGYHCHGLLKCESDIKPLWEVYQVVTGARSQGDSAYLKLKPFQKGGGAPRYCAKYLLKSYADYDML